LAVASRLFDTERYDDAAVLLNQLAVDGVGGVEREFLDGMVALAQKDYPRAEARFRKILEANPSLLRVRLELARVLFLQRKDEAADYHFRLASAEHLPKAAADNIARFREAIRARRAWRFNLNFGIAPDSNINSATSKERVDILGLPFQLDPSARARSGTGIIVAADASVRMRRDSKVPIYLAVYGRMVRYSHHQFDDVYVGGEAGPEFRLAGGRLRITGTALNRWYGGRQLVSSVGGRLNFDKIIGGKWGVEASLSVRRNSYARRSDVDGWDIDASLSANRAIGPSAIGFAYLGLQRSIDKDPGQSCWNGRIGGGLIKEIGWGLRPQLAVEVGRRVGDAPLAPFSKTRREWRLQVSASIYKRDWNIAGFAPSLRISYTRDFSTIRLYEQRRLRAEFGITKAF
jgi:hypothetical protein